MRPAHRLIATSVILSAVVFGGPAFAEISLVKVDGGFEFYTEGRVGGFFSGVQGDAPPKGYDAAGNMAHVVGDGAIPVNGLYSTINGMAVGPGKVLSTRVRSGFLGNIVSFGLRRNLTDTVRLTGYISSWTVIESEAREKYIGIVPDVREGYVRVDGPAGSLIVGRALALYSRGATEIDFLYAHRYGVGSPAGYELHGPAGGQVGYGVIANGFASGIIYATPSLAGLQLTAGYFDPATLNGLHWERTKLGRPEAELTYDLSFGKSGKVHLFANGAFQKVYLVDSDQDNSVWGVGGGGRFEISVLRLGFAGHSGEGLGFDYAFDGSNASVQTDTNQLRKFDGLYGQSQVVLGQFDLSAGVGVTRVHEVSGDLVLNPMTNQKKFSLLKQRMGINAGVVYHFSPFFHFDIDYFRAKADWQLGDTQVVNELNSGLTLTW